MTIFIIYIWNQTGQSTKNTRYLIGNNPTAAGKYSSWHKWPFSIISTCDSIPISFTAWILLASLSVIIVPEIQSSQSSFSALLRSWCFLVLVILVWTLMTDFPMLLSIPLVLYHYNSRREKNVQAECLTQVWGWFLQKEQRMQCAAEMSAVICHWCTQKLLISH